MTSGSNPAPMAIILVRPEGPRNVGAVARAMRNFGASDLRLVGAGAANHLRDDEAIAAAMAGRDLLESATVHPTLAAARAGLDVLVGATKRPGRRRAPCLAPWDLAAIAVPPRRYGIVLGNEVSGLTLAQLGSCDFLVRIPTVPRADSLNLAQAACVLLYEWHRRRVVGTSAAAAGDRRVEELLDHFRATLSTQGFLAPADPRHAVAKLRRYFRRRPPTEHEAGLWHAILQHWDRQHETSAGL